MSGVDNQPSPVSGLPDGVERDQLPTFVIGGARKTGTTALWRYLDAHPDIGMASIKEPKFFTRQRGRNVGAPDPAPAMSGNFDRGWRWYTELFAGHQNKSARGEASTMYFDAPDAPELLITFVPWVRLIFCLRHPVERIYSHYWHERQYDGNLPGFAELVGYNHPRLAWYVEQSHYARHLERFRARFPDEQILVVLSDDLAQRRNETLRGVCQFVGVDLDRLPSPLPVRHNVASGTRWPRLHRVLAHHRGDWTRPLPRFAVDRARRAKQYLIERNRRPLQYPELAPELRDALGRRFEDDIRYVEGLTNRNLPSWRC